MDVLSAFSTMIDSAHKSNIISYISIILLIVSMSAIVY